MSFIEINIFERKLLKLTPTVFILNESYYNSVYTANPASETIKNLCYTNTELLCLELFWNLKDSVMRQKNNNLFCNKYKQLYNSCLKQMKWSYIMREKTVFWPLDQDAYKWRSLKIYFPKLFHYSASSTYNLKTCFEIKYFSKRKHDLNTLLNAHF